MIIVALLESQFYSMNSSCIPGDVRNEIINFIPPFLTLVELRELTNRCLSLCTIRSLPWPAARLWTYSVHYMCPFIGDFHTAAAAVGKTAAVQCVEQGEEREGTHIHFPLPPPTPRRAKSNIFCQRASEQRWGRARGTAVFIHSFAMYGYVSLCQL